MDLKRLSALAATQDAALEHIDVSATRRRLLQLPRERRRSYRFPFAVMAAAAAAMVLWLLWPRPLEVSQHAGELRFTDGTRFVIEGDTHLGVEEVTALGADLVVDGSVWAHVTPREGARWSLKLGPYAISVTGTVFHASWDGSRLEVDLVEGGVTVLGPGLGTGYSMRAGERLTIDEHGELVVSKIDVAVVEEEPQPVAKPAVSAAAPAPTVSLSVSVPKPPVLPAWLLLARARRYEAALAAAKRHGWEQLCQTSTADRLVLLADVARFAGDGAASLRALSALRARYPKSPLAARAAFLLGRSAFAAKRGDWGARWFATYLAEAPGGALAVEAAGRLMEARAGSGNADLARSTARAYLERHPKGPHAALARTLLEGEP